MARFSRFKSGRHHGCNRGDDLAIPIILRYQETDMVDYPDTMLRRRLQALAWYNPLPAFIRITLPAATAGAAATCA